MTVGKFMIGVYLVLFFIFMCLLSVEISILYALCIFIYLTILFVIYIALLRKQLDSNSQTKDNELMHCPYCECESNDFVSMN